MNSRLSRLFMTTSTCREFKAIDSADIATSYWTNISVIQVSRFNLSRQRLLLGGFGRDACSLEISTRSLTLGRQGFLSSMGGLGGLGGFFDIIVPCAPAPARMCIRNNAPNPPEPSQTQATQSLRRESNPPVLGGSGGSELDIARILSAVD